MLPSVLDSLAKSRLLVTLEEHVFTGGFGSKVLEFLERRHITDALLERLALPDQFIEHGSREGMLDQFGLSPEKIAARILERLRFEDPVSLPNA